LLDFEIQGDHKGANSAVETKGKKEKLKLVTFIN
jgi:hypothetical protein